MRPAVIIRLNRAQLNKLKPIGKEVQEAYELGQKGVVIAQINTHTGLTAVSFVPHEKAKRIIEVLNDKS